MNPLPGFQPKHLSALPSRRVRNLIAPLALLALLAGGASAQSVYLSTNLDGLQELPPNSSAGTGSACLVLDLATLELHYTLEFGGMSSSETGVQIHGFAPAGAVAPVLFTLPIGSPIMGTLQLTDEQAKSMIAGLTYVNVHTDYFPDGEIRGQILPAPAPVEYCSGDGTEAAACPCGNPGQPGAGCPNAFTAGARLVATGFASLHCDSLNLTATQMTPSGTAVYLQGTSASAPMVFGDGLRCVGGMLKRIAVTTSVTGSSHVPAAGTPTISLLGGITMPGTYHYQTYYRDPTPEFCMPAGTYNITNAVRVIWMP